VALLWYDQRVTFRTLAANAAATPAPAAGV
jgi:hypothetical protein